VEGASSGLAEAATVQLREVEKRLGAQLQQDLQSKIVGPLEGLASLEARLQVGGMRSTCTPGPPYSSLPRC
jgi:hypothetical protein